MVLVAAQPVVGTTVRLAARPGVGTGASGSIPQDLPLPSLAMKIFSLRSTFACAVLCLGVALLLATVAVWLRFKIAIPVRDILRMMPLIEEGLHSGWGSISLQEWLAPISGDTHRVVVTRFLMLFDYTFLGGRNYAIYASAWLSILLRVGVYLKAAGLQLPQDRAGRCFVAGIALAYLCSPTLYLNLVNPISASWYVAFAGSAASLLIIIAAGKRLSFGWMVLACLFAAVAAFSNFAGLVACVVLPVVALHQRSRLSVLVLVFSVVLVYLFFHGIESSPAPVSSMGAPEVATGAGTNAMGKLAAKLGSPHRWPGLLKKITTSVGLHLGAPLSAKYPRAAAAAVLGSVILVGYQWLLLLYRWCRGREPGPRSVEFCLVMATICFGISCAIPLGRNVFNSPLSERYQNITMVYWLSISCLIFFGAQALEGRRKLKTALALLACLPVLPLFWGVDSTMTLVTAMSNQASRTQILGRMGVNAFEGKEDRALNRFAPLIAKHMEFLSGYGFGALDDRAFRRRAVPVEQWRCDGFSLYATPSTWPGVQSVQLQPQGISTNPFLARLDIRGNDGERGRLYADVPREYDLRSMFFDRRIWRGYYRGDVANSLPIMLAVDPVIGRRYQCILRARRP